MIRCLIVEDEPLAQQILERYIASVPEFRLDGKCANAVAAFEVLHNLPIDLVFLDIRMPRVSGVDFLRSLKDPPLVVFTTAYAEFAAQSYDLEAVDYLLKPITEERFRKCVDKVLKKATPAAPARTYVIMKVDGQLVRVPLEDIRYIESRKDYLKVVCTQGVYITHMTMKALEALLPGDGFARVHRSYVVAIAAIGALGPTALDVGGKTIPVGESYRKKVRTLLH